ncbi:sulfotransferase, partial [Luminiphilus sp.]|nr:sulfotransferase [Luminiphilus sp.]
KLVHVMRDPRDVVSSYIKMRWAPNSPIDAATWLKSITDRWRVMRSELPSHKFLEVRLEDLVEEPQHNLRKICDFWGVNWDESLMKTDLSKAHVGRWHRDLSREEGDEVTRMLETAIVDGGYCL